MLEDGGMEEVLFADRERLFDVDRDFLSSRGPVPDTEDDVVLGGLPRLRGNGLGEGILDLLQEG